MSPSCVTGLTPFFMIHGSETGLPADFGNGSPRLGAIDEEGSQTSLEDVMDQLEEAYDKALRHSPEHQQALRQRHNRNARERAPRVSNLVL